MKKAATVTEYLRATPSKPRAALQRLRKIIKAAAPGAKEVISYGIPTFRLNDRMLVSYAAFKNHCSFFPVYRRQAASHHAGEKAGQGAHR